MRRAAHLARKELRDILRERTIILALVTQFFVAAFSAFLTFGLAGLYDPESVQDFPAARVAYVGPGGFDEYLANERNLDVDTVSIAQATQGFQQRRYDAVVEELLNGTEGERTVTILLPDGEVRTTLTVTHLKNLLREYERDLREQRSERLEQELVFVETDARSNILVGFAFATLLPLLVATPVFLAGAITGDSFSQEVNAHTLTLLRSTPMSTLELILGKLATPVLLAPAQVFLWLLLMRANGLPIENVGWLLAATFVWALMLAASGLVVSAIVPREGTSQAAYTLLVILLGAASLAMPQDPLNLVARLGVGNPNAETMLSLLLSAALAAVALAAAWWAVRRRFAALAE